MLPSEQEGPHIQDDVLQHLHEGWDLMIAHPPCTYLTNAGVRHLHSVPSRNGVVTAVHGEARFQAMREAAAFFVALKEAQSIPRIAVENPIPHHWAREIIGWYDQIIQPWQFGHGEIKRTCLWLKNLPKLESTEIVDGRFPRCFKSPERPDRWKERSRTYTGIAKAMAEQWGGLSDQA
jgi:hypothetical protein